MLGLCSTASRGCAHFPCPGRGPCSRAIAPDCTRITCAHRVGELGIVQVLMLSPALQDESTPPLLSAARANTLGWRDQAAIRAGPIHVSATSRSRNDLARLDTDLSKARSSDG